MAKNSKPSKAENELRKRVADLERALDDATNRLKRARKDTDRSRADAEKAIRKASKSAQRKIAETVDSARDELARLGKTVVPGPFGGSPEEASADVSAAPSEISSPPKAPDTSQRRVAPRDDTNTSASRTGASRTTGTKTAAKKSSASTTTAKKTAAKKTTAKKTTAKKTTSGGSSTRGPYASMTVVELRKAAREKGVKGYSGMSKSELVSRLGS